MAYSISGVTLGAVVEESCRIESNLFVNPLVFNDPSGTDVGDFGGAVNTTTINGVITDTPANLATAWGTIRALVNGDQSSDNSYPKNFVSDIQGTIKVKFMDVGFTYLGGVVRKLGYSIKMVESSTNG